MEPLVFFLFSKRENEGLERSIHAKTHVATPTL